MTVGLSTAPTGTEVMTAIRSALPADMTARDILHHLAPHDFSAPEASPLPSRSDYESFEYKDGLLYRHGLLYIPAGPLRLRILQECHDTPAAGHFGQRKTHELLSRNYWWPNSRNTVDAFVRSCDTCCRAKAPRHLPHGLLQPLPVPLGPWRHISLDFITDLPISHGFDAVLVVIDRFSKMAHFVPCNKTIASDATAELLLREVFRLHGFPDNIVSDRGPQFIAKFWQRLLELLRIQ